MSKKNFTIEKLIDGFLQFKSENFLNSKNKLRYDSLVEKGQQPKTMVIACSDSRVDPAILFNTKIGELFVVRNVANLVPPYFKKNDLNGVSSAVEYAVKDLKVKNIIILGHAFCGGISHLCNNLTKFNSNDKQNSKRESLDSWVSIALPVIKRLDLKKLNDKSQHEVEKLSIKNSLKNLMTFPYVKDAALSGDLKLYGWWFDMKNSAIWDYKEKQNKFIKIKI